MSCGDAGCSTEEYRYGMVEDGAQAGTGKPYSSAQITDGQVKKCRSGDGKTGFSGNRENKISI